MAVSLNGSFQGHGHGHGLSNHLLLVIHFNNTVVADSHPVMAHSEPPMVYKGIIQIKPQHYLSGGCADFIY